MIHKIFTGTYIQAMQQCVREGYPPTTTRVVFRIRIAGELRNIYVDTCDAFAYGKNGKFKVILNSELLKTGAGTIKDGAYEITEEQYNNLEGKEFDKKELKLDMLL